MVAHPRRGTVAEQPPASLQGVVPLFDRGLTEPLAWRLAAKAIGAGRWLLSMAVVRRQLLLHCRVLVTQVREMLRRALLRAAMVLMAILWRRMRR